MERSRGAVMVMQVSQVSESTANGGCNKTATPRGSRHLHVMCPAYPHGRAVE